LLGEIEAAQVEYRQALAFDNDLVEARVGLSELRMPGDGYIAWLQRLHAVLRPETYLEIGIARGHSLCLALPPTRAIGVDPQPMIEVPLKAETHIFCETSDEFFAQHRLETLTNARPLSLAFIDGSHMFRQAVRDLINIERFCGPRSVLLLHDTVPFDEITQRPERQRRFYTGDVWKTVFCLKHYRPDLEIFTIATPPSGLTAVIGLEPECPVLAENYDVAVAQFENTSYSEVESRLHAELNVVPNDWCGVEARLKARGIIDHCP